MKCQGTFVFKSIEHVDKGSFTDGAGKVINFDGSYKLNVDEWGEDGKLNQVKLKIPEKSTDLVNRLKTLKPYQEITVDCNVYFYNNVPRVVPVDFKVNSNNK